MNELLKAVISLNIPSMIMVAIFGFFSYQFLQSSPELNTTRGFAGYIFLATTIITGVYAVIHYLIDENYKKIIDFQNTAMASISKTHTAIEESNQTKLTAKKLDIPGGYNIRDDRNPSTESETTS